MVQQYPYYKRCEKKIVVVLHIYGALDILLLFCDHQDTDYESNGNWCIYTKFNTEKNIKGYIEQ